MKIEVLNENNILKRKYIIKKNILLRELERKDAPTLYSQVEKSRKYLREHLPWLDENQSVNDSREFIELAKRNNALKKALILAIEVKGAVVGISGFNNIDSVDRIGRIGYWISKNHAKQGITTLAVRKLIEIGFSELNLNRIEIRCGTKNYASQRIAEKLQFKKEGTLKEKEWLYDRFVDHFLFAFLKKNFKKEKKL